jgi:hypothetical protein
LYPINDLKISGKDMAENKDAVKEILALFQIDLARK